MSEEPSPQVIEVEAGVRKERADKILSAHLAEHSRSRVQQLFADGLVWRDDEAITKSTRLKGGDTITYSIPPVKPLELNAVNIPLEVLFEDDDLLCVNKEPGMVVHPGNGTGEDTLVHALLHHCAGKLSGIGGVERPGIVHRLDRETSGLIVVAKSDRAYKGLSEQFLNRSLEKNYTAIGMGSVRGERGIIEEPIGRHPVHRHRMSVRENGRPSRSDWAVAERLGKVATLFDVRIHSGRTHQIRVHLLHLGHVLVGDTVYGFKAPQIPFEIPRVMLHARRLCLAHPVSGAAMEIEAPLPADFIDVMERLRSL